MTSTHRVGLISDTHGLLRAEAIEGLQGSDFIIHAGDIGDPDILRQLAEIAPVTAVRGNNDNGSWASAIPETNVLQIGDIFIYAIHDLAELDIDPVGAGFQVVVAGHSHRPLFEHREGVLFINPGSAGPRRFTLPISLGYLAIEGSHVTPHLIELNVAERNK